MEFLGAAFPRRFTYLKLWGVFTEMVKFCQMGQIQLAQVKKLLMLEEEDLDGGCIIMFIMGNSIVPEISISVSGGKSQLPGNNGASVFGGSGGSGTFGIFKIVDDNTTLIKKGP